MNLSILIAPIDCLQAIRKEFLYHLPEDDQLEEVAAIQILTSAVSLTSAEWEAAARPTDSGDYWSEWDTFRAAQRIFAEEVSEIDSQSRDKSNKKKLGNRTVAVRKWFSELPKSKVEEAERAAAKWNADGAYDKEKMAV